MPLPTDLSTATEAQIADGEARRLQDYLMHKIEPRIPGVQVQPIAVAGGFAIVVRVPQSWAGPHRVGTNQHFFIREGRRKRQLNVPEVRGLFLRSEQQAQRVRDFRTERLGKIMAGESPCLLAPGPLLVVHFVPTQAALGLVQVDPVPYVRTRELPLLSMKLGGARLNADGALVTRSYGNEKAARFYSQFFRNGFFETVRVLMQGDRAALGSIAYEQHLINLVANLWAEYSHLGVGLEMACMMSITDANKVTLGLDGFRYMLADHQGRFDRKTLILPDVLLQADMAPEQVLRPMFDLVWQSAGLERSFNYNSVGEWAPQ
jgi:hypothetical protein